MTPTLLLDWEDDRTSSLKHGYCDLGINEEPDSVEYLFVTEKKSLL